MPRILLVDDEPDLVELIGTRLTGAGYEVLSAYDGQEGYEKARTENPDLIILDLKLPKMDGYRICQSLKSDEKYKKIPIIMFTALGEGLDLERIVAMELGADAYINKSFEPPMLLAKIQELLAGC